MLALLCNTSIIGIYTATHNGTDVKEHNTETSTQLLPAQMKSELWTSEHN
jgi:hypothetical protein